MVGAQVGVSVVLLVVAGLFLRALDCYIDQSLTMLDERLAAGPLRQALMGVFESGIRLGSSEGGRTCLLSSTTMHAAPSQEELVAKVNASHERMRRLFARHLARGQQEGTVRTDQDADDLARFVLNTSMGMQILARGKPDPQELRRVAELALSAVFV